MRASDTTWFNEQNYGLLALTNNVINALETYMPVDADCNALSLMGYELEEMGTYSRKQPLKEKDLFMTWGCMRMLYKFEYHQLLNPPQAFKDCT